MMEITHTSRCDTVGCINNGIDFDAYSEGGNLLPVFCAGCSTDITHTCTPKE